MAINGQIIDEINGLIASRDSIRATMKAAGIASDTSKLADLATNLAKAKLGATTYNVSSLNQTIPAGKLTTGAQTIRAVTTSGIDAANIASNAWITSKGMNDAVEAPTAMQNAALNNVVDQVYANAGLPTTGNHKNNLNGSVPG